jgi:hypothetical protein
MGMDSQKYIFSTLKISNKLNRWEAKMNIMVGYDRSNVAIEALGLAKKHAKAFGGKV